MWKAPAPTGAGAAATRGWTRDGGAVTGGTPRARFAACACNVEGGAPDPEAPSEACAGVAPDAVAYMGGLAAEPVVHVGRGPGTPSPPARTGASASSKPTGVETRTAVVGWTGPGETRTVRTR